MEYATRMRPKGYNLKVWLALFSEAEINKQWAVETIKKNTEFANNASQSSLEMLGAYLHKPAHLLAKESYDYLYMRACGQTFMGALDSSARERFESLMGRKIAKTRYWEYDHTIRHTSDKLINGNWSKPYDPKRS